jgi:hypothetical protein
VARSYDRRETERYRRQAERWLAMEFIVVVLIRTIHGFVEQHDLLGPQSYAAMIAAYGLLSVLVLFSATAELGAVFGALIVLAVLMRPTKSGSIVGVETARSVAAFTGNVAKNPPTLAHGVAK